MSTEIPLKKWKYIRTMSANHSPTCKESMCRQHESCCVQGEKVRRVNAGKSHVVEATLRLMAYRDWSISAMPVNRRDVLVKNSTAKPL